MRHLLRYSTVFVLLLVCTLNTAEAQTRLSYGLHLSPEVNYIASTPKSGSAKKLTTGKSGMASSVSLGGYLEYEVIPNIYVRGGMNIAVRRHYYEVERRFEETDEIAMGENRITYYAIEMPGAIIARTNYMKKNDRFLIGVGGVLNRWIGDPWIENDFVNGSFNPEYRNFAKQTVSGFIGYEFELSRHSSMSIEPYISYTPTRFYFENYSYSDVVGEGGVSFRVRFDS
ncbi:hypothetical protein [Lewinella sp. IMCC34191]|uniref:hypothetical protein n=1 Tax=Lewinella sp. IMCC34191 TaxID=2259172 RepID=UPI000E2869FA|nr:hypothetical protein [Lewinella sp. IMCC34191]